MSESSDPLARAIELSIEFESGDGEKDIETFLAQHEELRDILEPLIRPDDEVDERTVLGDFELIREGAPLMTAPKWKTDNAASASLGLPIMDLQ